MTNSSEISWSALALTAAPLATAFDLPSLFTVRVRINSPDSEIIPLDSKRSANSCGILKVALAIARSWPCLTSAASALPPRTRFSAVKTMVLPAPVSPVITVKPGPI